MIMRFEPVLHRLFDAVGPRVDDPGAAASTLGALLASEGPASPSARRYLEESGLREAWNHTLLHARSACLADWLAPYAVGPMIDVFAGDFSVTRALHVRTGAPIIAVERPAIAAAARGNDCCEIWLIDDPSELSAIPGATAILCTALHHESDPMQVLGVLAQGRSRRWLVVENCIDEHFDSEFQCAADSFFNHCLNDTPLYCGPQHRSASCWRRVLAEFGQVRLEETRDDIPGVFLPHTFYLVERDGY